MTKSDELTCKVDNASKLVEDFKYAFQSLDEDVEALESIKSLVDSQERDNKVEMKKNKCDQEEQLEAIESALEEKKETAEDVRKFSHPCGDMAGRELPILTSEEMTQIVLLGSGLVKGTSPMFVC